MLIGSYFALLNATLCFAAACAYLAQGDHWRALYWFACVLIAVAVTMKG